MKENLDFKYDILTTLYIEYSSTGQVILEKNYPIIENKTIQQYTNKISINEKINIFFDSIFSYLLFPYLIIMCFSPRAKIL